MGGGLSKHEDTARSESMGSLQQASSSRTAANSTANMMQQAGATPPARQQDEEQSSGCPMKRADGSYSYDWKALFRSDNPHRPGGSEPLDQQEYNVYSQPIDPTNNMPAVANQLPAPTQNQKLSTERVASNIPKGGTGADNSKTWTYPSPQMFYNALVRKGKANDTQESDMEIVVAMHNNMNEKTWKKVLQWERLEGSESPKLLKFQGRPTELSPKAAFKHYVFGHPLPFDRHDWTVLREDGTTVRYVIDYYYDESRAREDGDGRVRMDDESATPSLLVDVRPALDGLSLAYNRAIRMPLARRTDGSDFEPLQLLPTSELRQQVSESLQVWKNIISKPEPKIDISKSQAEELSKHFAKIHKDCRAASKRVDACESEAECAKASVDLSICMAQIVCPLQHSTLIEALKMGNDDTIEAALKRVDECVTLKSSEKLAAKEKFPELFR